MIATSDGALTFTEMLKFGRITTAGAVSEFQASGGVGVNGITAGPDRALWFTEPAAGKIGRMTLPSSDSPLLSAVLPSSRSVQMGNAATAFATIINAGTTTANGGAIAPVTSVPASFTYQTTDPPTNALTGSSNTPASIAAGKSQSFVFAFAPNAPVMPTVTTLGFSCNGLAAAPSNAGLNTLLYSASASSVPDIVALAATSQNNGILHVPGTSGSGAFAVATVNVGASAAITATANTGPATLPLSVTLCQTDPSSSQCLGPPAMSVSITINGNATPTFAIFATATAPISFLPGANRIFVQFSDGGGTVRGSISVAVTTQ